MMAQWIVLACVAFLLVAAWLIEKAALRMMRERPVTVDLSEAMRLNGRHIREARKKGLTALFESCGFKATEFDGKGDIIYQRPTDGEPHVPSVMVLRDPDGGETELGHVGRCSVSMCTGEPVEFWFSLVPIEGEE